METTTATEQNYQRLLQILDHNSLDEALSHLDKYYTDDFVRHGDKGDYDKDRLGEGWRRLYVGFPDLERALYDLIADGDRVAYRWVATGTHRGEYLGVRPTNRRIHTEGMVMCRFEDGKIAEEWGSWDRASVLFSLGIIPLGH